MTNSRSLTRSPFLWLAGLVLAAAMVAVLATGGDEDEPVATATETAAVTVTGQALPPYIPGNEDPAVGLAAPLISGLSFDDSTVTADQPGSRIIGFFAHWCPHCQRELPIVEEWLRRRPRPRRGGVPCGIDRCEGPGRQLPTVGLVQRCGIRRNGHGRRRQQQRRLRVRSDQLPVLGRHRCERRHRVSRGWRAQPRPVHRTHQDRGRSTGDRLGSRASH